MGGVEGGVARLGGGLGGGLAVTGDAAGGLEVGVALPPPPVNTDKARQTAGLRAVEQVQHSGCCRCGHDAHLKEKRAIQCL